MNRDYELTLLARTDVSDADVKVVFQMLKDIIISNGGSIVYVEYWGMRQLEYKINKSDSATFYMLQIKSNKEINALLRERLKNSEIFMRYLLVGTSEKSLKLKTPNCLSSVEQQEDGVVFDKRYCSVLSSVFD